MPGMQTNSRTQTQNLLLLGEVRFFALIPTDGFQLAFCKSNRRPTTSFGVFVEPYPSAAITINSYLGSRQEQILILLAC